LEERYDKKFNESRSEATNFQKRFNDNEINYNQDLESGNGDLTNLEDTANGSSDKDSDDSDKVNNLYLAIVLTN